MLDLIIGIGEQHLQDKKVEILIFTIIIIFPTVYWTRKYN